MPELSEIRETGYTGGFHNVSTTGDVNLVTLGGLHNASTVGDL